MSLKSIANYINGERLPPIANDYLDTINPATNEKITTLPNSNKYDLDLAINAAKKAIPIWQAMPMSERASYLLAIAKLIKKHKDTLAELECIDTGKPLQTTQSVDIPRAAENFEFFAKCANSDFSKVYDMQDKGINFTQQKSLGIVACISPWNLPLYLFTWKIAPALLMGNCVIAKPSEVTPLTADYLAKLCIEADLPAGVLNILHGKGNKIGQAIIEHKDIKAISFTGGTETGKHIAQSAAKDLKKVSLELGGKNASIIFADCDFEKMLATTIKSSFSNQGQICLCTSRLYIENSIYEQFKNSFVAAAADLIVGDPYNQETTQGAVVSELHYNKILSHIEQAKAEGAVVLLGGEVKKVPGRCKHGFFVKPTILENLKTDSKTNQTEIFGPVVSLIPFNSENEAIVEANNSTYGLCSVVWTQDINRAHRVSRKLDTGIVWVNQWMLRDLRTPFGGQKHSGVGREGGKYALEFFSETTNICIGF